MGTSLLNAPAVRALRSKVFEQPDELQHIWNQWDDLAVRVGAPYGAPAWLMSWWRHVAVAGWRLRVVTVFEENALVAVAPFFCDRGLGGVRRWRLVGAGTSAPLDILAIAGRERDVAPLIVGHVAAGDPRPDVVMLEGIPAASPWPALLRAFWPRAGRLAICPQFSQPAPFVALHGSTYGEWFDSQSAHWRKKMRYAMKKSESYAAIARMSRDDDELKHDLETFAELHHRRWSVRGGSSAFDVRVQRMLEECGAELMHRGRMRLWSLEIDGRTISSSLFVSAGGRTAYWLGGFDHTDSRVISPGLLTIRAALEHAFRAGDALLDLGPGGQPYKYEFSRMTHEVEWILLVPRGWRSLAARAQLARLRARMQLAKALSPRAKRMVRQLRTWSAGLRRRRGQ